MADKIASRIDSLEQRLKELKAQQQRAEARKRSLKARRDRREDLRRKILVGAVVLQKVEQGEIEERQFLGWLAAALTRDEDRALFDLSPRGATPP